MKTIKSLTIISMLFATTGCETSFDQLEERRSTEENITEAMRIFEVEYINGIDAGAIRKIDLGVDIWETDIHAGYKLLSSDFIPQWLNAQIDEGVITLESLSEVSYFASTYSDVNLSLSQIIPVSQKNDN
jgi:hypothetical protein